MVMSRTYYIIMLFQHFLIQVAVAYIVFHHNIHKNWQIWAKLSSSLYTDNQSIGSGFSEILHSRRTEFRFQVLYRF